MSTTDPIYQYGHSTEVFVSRRESDHSLVLGGMGQSEPWVHVMTRRAAQVLWFKLTLLLYPEKATMVTGLATTAPLRMVTGASVTTHVEVVHSGNDEYTLSGWYEQEAWRVQLTEQECRRLWAALDLALYPVGWEGRVTKPKALS